MGERGDDLKQGAVMFQFTVSQGQCATPQRGAFFLFLLLFLIYSCRPSANTWPHSGCPVAATSPQRTAPHHYDSSHVAKLPSSPALTHHLMRRQHPTNLFHHLAILMSCTVINAPPYHTEAPNNVPPRHELLLEARVSTSIVFSTGCVIIKL